MADLEVVQGAYGETITLTLQNKQGTAQDVSSYDGDKEISFRAPRNLKVFSSTADFNSDGIDGKIDFVFDADTNPDIDGDWECTVELAKTGVLSRSFPFLMHVAKSVR